MKPLPLSLSLVVLLAACSKPADTASTADATAQPSAVAAMPAPATTAAAPDATAEVELTMANVDQWISAQKQIAAATQSDPSLDPAINVSRENGEQYAARLEATPKLRAAIEQAGLSTREYAVISESLIAALMAVGAVEAGALKEIPDGMDPQHIAFVKAHKAELEQKLQAMGPEG